MAYFPLFVDLKNKNILIVGGGKVAFRKIMKLIPFEGEITIVAPEICFELENFLEENKNITFKKKTVDIDDIKEAFMVISATNDKTVNNFVANTCKSLSIPVNSVDDIENCSFIFPAIVKRGNFVAGLSTEGKAPEIAAYLKEAIGCAVPENIEQVIENIGLLRQELKLTVPEQTVRAQIIHSVLDYYKRNSFTANYQRLKKEMDNILESISTKI